MKVDREKVREGLEHETPVPLESGGCAVIPRDIGAEALEALLSAAEEDEELHAALLRVLSNDQWAYMRGDWTWFARYDWAVE